MADVLVEHPDTGSVACGDDRPHDTRHTAATLLLEAGIPVKVVSERLGHTTTSITADLYQHVAPHMQEEAANKLGAMLLGDPKEEAGS